jgi:proteasome lid subunit RPN8/RPN11
VIGEFFMPPQLTLALTRAQSDAICHHAEQAYPEECCGVLLGITGDTQVVTSVQALPNAWTPTVMAELMALAIPSAGAVPDPVSAVDLGSSGRDAPQTTVDPQTAPAKTDRYWIDPADLLQVMLAARAQSLEMIGIYHSHPDHPAVASETDRQLACPQYAYVIVSVIPRSGDRLPLLAAR